MKRIRLMTIALLLAALMLGCFVLRADLVFDKVSNRLIKKSMADFSILEESEEYTVSLKSQKTCDS